MSFLRLRERDEELLSSVEEVELDKLGKMKAEYIGTSLRQRSTQLVINHWQLRSHAMTHL
jgi:hypothetical protein